jgi:hypothetical protein
MPTFVNFASYNPSKEEMVKLEANVISSTNA